MSKNLFYSLKIPEELSGIRLDRALAKLLPQFSRARLQQWIKENKVKVNGKFLPPKSAVTGGELVDVRATLEEETASQGEDIALNVVYEDESIIVINKPAGLVVHPGSGINGGTLLNALLYYDPGLASIPRAGIVHRLDKGTTGLLVIARSLAAHKSLVDQIQARTMIRSYQSVVYGVMTAGGTINQPVGRHPNKRVQMAVVRSGKEAITHYRVLQRFNAHSHIRVKLETGRTHQIRVHMFHHKYPVVGDPVYKNRGRIQRGTSPALAALIDQLGRQALHAEQLGLSHPVTGESMLWHAELPQDMQDLIDLLKNEQESRL